jgi:DNA-binding LytR/AlgR family response regulator
LERDGLIFRYPGNKKAVVMGGEEMIRIAIVDDEAEVRDILKSFIVEYSRTSGERFEVTTFSDGSEIVEGYKPEYDIIFLDIQMPKMDGMTAAEKIRSIDEDVIMIFITNMANYAIKGYSVNALDFVIKPVLPFAFSQQLAKAISQMKKKKDSFLVVQHSGGIVKLDLAKVTYFESMGHRITVHTLDEEYTFNDSLKNMEQKLPSSSFTRCNNCYLVNLAHVESVNQDMATVGGHKLKISRPRKADFMNALADYIGGVQR